MKLFSIRGTDIVCSPLLLAAVPFAVIFGRLPLLLTAFFSLTVHELSHAVFSARLGCPVRSIEIQPFGFVARIESGRASAGEIAAVYAAGPFASIMMAAGSSLIAGLVPAFSEAAPGFAEYNLLIFAVNMLPAIPLDGGRLIYAAACGKGRKPALTLLKTSGVLVGSAFVSVFILLLIRGYINPTFGIMGVFLIISALREGMSASLPSLNHRRVKGRRTVPIQQTAISGELSIAETLLLLPPGRYSVIGVVDGSGRIMANIDEGRLIEAAQSIGANASLSEAVDIYTRRVI